MRGLRALLLRLGGLFNKHHRDRELTAELESHLQMHIEDNIRAGMTPEEARCQALIKLGGVEQTKENYRDRRGLPWLETLVADIRFALRMLRKSPSFTAVAILTLALAIGANTAIFSLIDALLLRSLPVHDPQELVLLKWSARKAPSYYGYSSYGDCDGRSGGDNPSGCSFSHPFFDELRAHAGIFSGVTASGGTVRLDLGGIGPASVGQALMVSGNYFDMLGVRPAVGRMIEPSDEELSAPPVAVLNYGYWQTAFGGSLSIVGKTVGLNGVPATIVGVAEPRFASLTPGNGPDAWLPLSLKARLSPRWNPKQDGAGSMWLLIIGRLKSDVPRKRAEAAVSLLFRNEMIYGPQPLSKETDAPAVSLVPAQTGLVGARGRYSTPLFVLMAAVGIVLLIASANVAGLLLARSTVRQKEMAVRLALGAGRGRIVRQLLTESMLLSAFGGALGILLAVWVSHAILAFVASGSTRPLGFDASIDTRVLLFTAEISLLTGIVFGLAPAIRGTRVDLTAALKEGASGLAGAARARNRWLNVGNALVIGQVALTMLVLVGAGLVIRTLQNLKNMDPGFDTSNVLNFKIDPTLIGYKGTRVDALYRNLQERLSAIPSVTSVSYSGDILLSGGMSATSFHLAGAPETVNVDSDYLQIGPDFFATMKIPLLKGRDFQPVDFLEASAAAATSASAPAPKPAANTTALPSPPPQPAIVNETFVRRYFESVDPLRQHFRRARDSQTDPGFVVVGIVRDTKYSDLRREIHPTAYFAAVSDGVAFELRTAGNPTSIIPAVRSTVNQLDSNLPISDVVTESESIDQLLFQERLIARLSSFFGVLALVLACIGLYGLLSYDVTRRTREIGIRVTLGAGQGDVLRIVMGQGFGLALVGVIVGGATAVGVTRYLGSILYGVRPGDPLTLVTVALILLLVAVMACFIPARRATKVDPMVALRHE